jgi:hypothetical protein
MKTSFNEGPSREYQTIQLVSLNTGATATQPMLIPKRAVKRKLEKILEDGSGKIPGLPGYTVAIAIQKGAATAGVRRLNEDILTFGIGLEPTDGHDLWVWMIDFRAHLLGRLATDDDFARFPKPICYPWIAELMHPDAGPLTNREAEKLTSLLSELTVLLWKTFCKECGH